MAKTAAAAPAAAPVATDADQPAGASPTTTASRLAIIEAAGVSLQGRTAAQGGPSKYRGVVWHKSNSKWEARIYETGKQRFLGYFSSEDEAALTYDDYAARIHGTSAKLNFPDTYHGVVLPKPTHAAPAVVRQHHVGGTRSTAAAAAFGGAAVGGLNIGNSGIPGPRGTTTAPQNTLHSHEAGAGGYQHLHPPAHPPRRPGSMRVQPIKGSSSFRGVSWNSNCHKWRAQVWKGSEVHHLGYFEHEEDAARAYDAAVLRIRGPDAPTNYPRSQYGVYSDNDEVEEQFVGTSPTVTAAAAASPSGFYPFTKFNASRNGSGALAVNNNNNNNAINNMNGNVANDNGSSTMLGVSWSDYHNSWVAEIWDGKKYQLLGIFPTEAEAAKAYDLACLAQHGSDALTNFSLENYPNESAALALVGIAHDPHGYEELYGSGFEKSRSVTPTGFQYHQQQQQYYSTNDLSTLTHGTTTNTNSPGRQTVVIHNPNVNGGFGGKRRAVTPPVASGDDRNDIHHEGSLRFNPTPTTAAAVLEAKPVVNVEEFNALYGQLQNFIAGQQQQQQQQMLPVAPLQSSGAPMMSENAQQTLMALLQAAAARQQQQEAAAAAAAAAQQRHAVAAAIQNWAFARQQQQQQQQQAQQQIHVAPAPAPISLKRDFSNFSSLDTIAGGSNNNTIAAAQVAAVYQALLSHQMNAAAKRPRV